MTHLSPFALCIHFNNLQHKQNLFFNFSTPGGNSISACELTCILIGTLARPVVPAAVSMTKGLWDRKLYSGSELYGKTLAILGLGRIGREVSLRMRAWGMRVKELIGDGDSMKSMVNPLFADHWI